MSNAATHTPGPWHFEIESTPGTQKVKCPSCQAWRRFGEFNEPAAHISAGGAHPQDYQNQTWICGVGFAQKATSTDLANARLIAAAPAMLVALKAYRSQYLDDRGTWPDDEAETLALADAAIAAAEGRV